MKNKNVISYKSEFDPSFTVYLISKDYKNYKTFKKALKGNNIAYTTPEKVILIDSEQLNGLTRDHVKFIEAHEVAHHLLNHEIVYGDAENEREADYTAYLLLNKYNYGKAKGLVVHFFKERHGCEFNQEELLKIKERINL